jgi:regulator of protease activity HflC (stomatin/prohibitin superfamily)
MVLCNRDMRNPLLHVAAFSLLSLSIGCTASGQMHSSASVSTPDLVFINSDVQVIADYDEPIFYTSNYYWRYDGGVWYRSSNHRSGWVRIQVVPVAIQRIDRPTAYIHYRGEGRANVQPALARDQRDAQKEERKEVKEAQKEERKEAKEEAKEERKEAKEERKEAKEERKEAKDAQKDSKPGKPPKK